ncbi:hypothetical protein EC396_10965 [Lutibacter sp. HS1-25]|uniref:DUF6526 family protein n=1 Tax=Lutibacter sp. HS1-25 TaxID=2485000 RepID=UPI001013BCEC|nr:DUF6526 family protein [Lutibacter sp. HS1-25]RXP52639.1 hypothetical protein EC396_10965 [Lutibacter sp. HS1-25]
MKQQTYKNHARMVLGFHGFTFLAILLLLIGSIRNLINSSADNLYLASLLVLVSIILLLLFFYLRSFALKAQDRAIRAEEKLRYFILTSKRMSTKLTTRQIIGLRFAPDDEFPALVDKAIKENLSEKEIKLAIKNWKPDTYRV